MENDISLNGNDFASFHKSTSVKLNFENKDNYTKTKIMTSFDLQMLTLKLVKLHRKFTPRLVK